MKNYEILQNTDRINLKGFFCHFIGFEVES